MLGMLLLGAAIAEAIDDDYSYTTHTTHYTPTVTYPNYNVTVTRTKRIEYSEAVMANMLFDKAYYYDSMSDYELAHAVESAWRYLIPSDMKSQIWDAKVRRTITTVNGMTKTEIEIRVNLGEYHTVFTKIR